MSRKDKSKKSKGKSKKVQEGYQPTGGSVSWEVAMSQAIIALDHSAALAIKTNSPDGLKEVARGWLAVADTLSENSSDMEVHDLEETSDAYAIGFRQPPQTDYDEMEEEEDDIYEPDFKFKAHHTFPANRTRGTR